MQVKASVLGKKTIDYDVINLLIDGEKRCMKFSLIWVPVLTCIALLICAVIDGILFITCTYERFLANESAMSFCPISIM